MMQTSLISWTLNAISPQLDCFTPPVDMRAAVSRITQLPPLPGIAQRILQLATDPYADTTKLADIIELDPFLTAQVIRWASSSFYGYKGKILSVNDAITRVLGFDYVLNLALSLSALRPLKAPREGIIGTKMFWTHSLASAGLMKLLSEKMSVDKKPVAQQVFLAALMHNIGFPLLGDQFPNEFDYLQRLIVANPSLAIHTIEKFAFGVDHTLLGTWLMNSWAMPKVITDIVYHHHNPNYRGENCQLNQLTFLNDCLLGQLGIGDALQQICPDEIFVQLGLTKALCNEILEQFSSGADQIKADAELLSA
ncbi:MAG: HDOD domain-containing protein [Methylococcales bacterium]